MLRPAASRCKEFTCGGPPVLEAADAESPEPFQRSSPRMLRIIYGFCIVKYMKNVQISIDQETLAQVDRVGKPLGLKRSEIVRQALRDWLRRHAVERFEKEWIAALQKHADEPARADEWVGIQAWSNK